MTDVIDEYNKISDYKIDKKAADYQFLSNTGYTLENVKIWLILNLKSLKFCKTMFSR